MDKYRQHLNQQKFDRIAFAIDYIRQIQQLQGELKTEDFTLCLSKLYDDAFDDGRADVLDRLIYQAFHELDEIEEKR